MYFLFIFLCIIILKFLLNLSRYINTCVCFKKYVSNSANLEQLIPFVEHVWDSAKTNTLVMIEYASSTEYAKLSDLLCDISYSKRINSTFNQTIGVYKFRMLQCINPFYWIFLPRYIFNFLDVHWARRRTDYDLCSALRQQKQRGTAAAGTHHRRIKKGTYHEIYFTDRVGSIWPPHRRGAEQARP